MYQPSHGSISEGGAAVSERGTTKQKKQNNRHLEEHNTQNATHTFARNNNNDTKLLASYGRAWQSDQNPLQ